MNRHDIQPMKQSPIYCGVVILAISAGSAFAQMIPPGSSQFSPPPPPPPPPPKIEVPAIPRMDELPSRSYAPPPQRSFGDKINRCLDDAAASGLSPTARTTYSRNCATRQGE
ncbi:MAG: hypothetical protein ACRC1G_02190 [Bradyrhizobium sp.]|nr:hypothetical protein [Bradyrhizobium sp.]